MDKNSNLIVAKWLKNALNQIKQDISDEKESLDESGLPLEVLHIVDGTCLNVLTDIVELDDEIILVLQGREKVPNYCVDLVDVIASDDVAQDVGRVLYGAIRNYSHVNVYSKNRFVKYLVDVIQDPLIILHR